MRKFHKMVASLGAHLDVDGYLHRPCSWAGNSAGPLVILSCVFPSNLHPFRGSSSSSECSIAVFLTSQSCCFWISPSSLVGTFSVQRSERRPLETLSIQKLFHASLRKLPGQPWRQIRCHGTKGARLGRWWML